MKVFGLLCLVGSALCADQRPKIVAEDSANGGKLVVDLPIGQDLVIRQAGEEVSLLQLIKDVNALQVENGQFRTAIGELVEGVAENEASAAEANRVNAEQEGEIEIVKGLAGFRPAADLGECTEDQSGQASLLESGGLYVCTGTAWSALATQNFYGVKQENPASSCEDIAKVSHFALPSGKYYVGKRQQWCAFEDGQAINMGGDGSGTDNAGTSCESVIFNWGMNAGSYFIRVGGTFVKTYCNAQGEAVSNGMNEAQPAASCAAILASYPGSKSGLYFVGDSKIRCNLQSGKFVTIADGSVDYPTKGLSADAQTESCRAIKNTYPAKFENRGTRAWGGPFYAYGGSKVRAYLDPHATKDLARQSCIMKGGKLLTGFPVLKTPTTIGLYGPANGPATRPFTWSSTGVKDLAGGQIHGKFATETYRVSGTFEAAAAEANCNYKWIMWFFDTPDLKNGEISQVRINDQLVLNEKIGYQVCKTKGTTYTPLSKTSSASRDLWESFGVRYRACYMKVEKKLACKKGTNTVQMYTKLNGVEYDEAWGFSNVQVWGKDNKALVAYDAIGHLDHALFADFGFPKEKAKEADISVLTNYLSPPAPEPDMSHVRGFEWRNSDQAANAVKSSVNPEMMHGKFDRNTKEHYGYTYLDASQTPYNKQCMLQYDLFSFGNPKTSWQYAVYWNGKRVWWDWSPTYKCGSGWSAMPSDMEKHFGIGSGTNQGCITYQNRKIFNCQSGRNTLKVQSNIKYDGTLPNNGWGFSNVKLYTVEGKLLATDGDYQISSYNIGIRTPDILKPTTFVHEARDPLPDEYAWYEKNTGSGTKAGYLCEYPNDDHRDGEPEERFSCTCSNPTKSTTCKASP
jgi:hypothetical protein